MLDFVIKNCRTLVELVLWLILIFCTIVGWNLGETYGHICKYKDCSGDAYQILGALFGLAVGFIADIFIAIFVWIGENLEIIKNNFGIKTPEAVAVQQGFFIDSRDGKTYKTVKIGSQTWMAENLNYNASGSKCYGNDENNCRKYGRLYDWNTAMKSCPPGWHLPSKSEWEALGNVAGGEKVAGKKLKADSSWNKDGNGTDDYGFSALPGGYGNSDGYFGDVGNNGNWWSATEDSSDGAYYREMYYSSSGVGAGNFSKSYLFSVRCVQD